MNVAKNVHCYGCGVCALSCPKKIISIELNQEGFYIPKVKEDSCINCGWCTAVCSYMHEDMALEENTAINSYAAWSCNDDIRQNCSSGGIVFAIASKLLQEGYDICAVKYDDKEHQAKHYVSKTIEDLYASVGSKYIQSYTLDGLCQIDLHKKNVVVGTPCMIDSFRRFIRKKKVEENFLLIDFFCHGVPSALLWKKYAFQLERELGHLETVYWRYKNNGWHDSLKLYAKGAKGEYNGGLNQGDIFFKTFLGDCSLGRACYDKCKFKMLHSSADIRVGDLWGPTYLNDDKGVSGVLAITKKGQDLLNSLPNCVLKEENTEIVMEGQMPKAPEMPIIRLLLLYLFKNKQRSLRMENAIIEVYAVWKKVKKIILNPQVVLKNRLGK